MMADRVGQQLGNYKLTKLLGEGAFAQVFLGDHIYLGTQAAIKVLDTRLEVVDQENFLYEARTLARLDHPNIVKVLEFGFGSSTPFLVMNYAPNGSLRSRHPKGTPLPLDTILLYIKQIATALQYAHDQKLIHRDIKPENMLIGRNNEVLISDFGISVVAHSINSQRTQSMAGTPAYMAPEQIQGKPHQASDQYALGIVVYEWLCGERPFQGDLNALTFQHVYSPPPSLREKLPDLSPNIEQVVMTALSKNPHQRFVSVQAFTNALEQACQPKKSLSVTLPPAVIQTKPNESDECFLCSLDSQSCAVHKLEGLIIAAREVNVDGEMIPFITIDLGTEYASFSLTRYYRKFVKGLIELGNDLRKRKLTLSAYHLPSAISTTEYNSRKLYRYRTNAYTVIVLEPDTVLNITDLNHAEYCSRQYLLHRLVSFPQSSATIRGNIIHHCFKELLKDYERGNGQKTVQEALNFHFEEALERNSIELALSNISSEAMRIEVSSHLENLANWFQRQSSSLWDLPTFYNLDDHTDDVDEWRREGSVRAETFLLVPKIGLKGRLDLLWRQSGRQRLLELKSGGAKGDLPKPDHKWQVLGYHALLTVNRDSKMKRALATLLYSGTLGSAQDFIIPFTIKQLHRVIEERNILVLSHITGTPAPPPGTNRCTKCTMLNHCMQVSRLLNWQSPQPDLSVKTAISNLINLENDTIQPYGAITINDRKFFAKYYDLLQLEGHEGERQQALLWKESIEKRILRGWTIRDLNFKELEQRNHSEWCYTFLCNNESELRDGDEVLLSNGNPITGEVVRGTIVSISAKAVKVWTSERINNPTRIDQYSTDLVHLRTLQNLLRWLQVNPHLRSLVYGTIRPQFDTTKSYLPHKDFNIDQNLAVQRAMQMRDYMLIHGPPGTGKTRVIAEIVKRYCMQGQRVLLAAFTNQAVDNMLKCLDSDGYDFMRLGSEQSVDKAIEDQLLKRRVGNHSKCADTLDAVQDLLRNVPVLASTTATWSSDKYTLSFLNGTKENQEHSLFQFDVAIIDEAGQLTVPAILGVLRFSKRFILVGDEQQLPPLVLSKVAKDQGLGESLFERLKHINIGYTNNHPEAISACVSLKTQYRMNKEICDFASQTFYENELKSDSSVANRVLEFNKPDAESISETHLVKKVIDPKHPIVFLNIRGEQEGVKTSNAEARAILKIISSLLARGVAEREIGIIAPYRAQVANLRRHLFSDDETIGWKALLDNTRLNIDTVDRFQGGERPVIIMSFATTTRPEVDSQLREHLTNPNRLNVALTRAQKKLILVGNASAIEGLPVFERLLVYCKGLNTIIPYDYQV